MPAVIILLWGAFIAIVGTIVKEVLAGLAIGAVTYIGVKFVLDWFVQGAVSQFSSLPAEIYQVMSLVGVGNVISLYVSAFTVRMVLSGFNSASGKKTSLGMIPK